MPGEKILVIDDDKPISDLIKSYLNKEGYQYFAAYDGADALKVIDKVNPDLIILDVMLPSIEGPALCLEIRKRSNVPIIFLSCKSEEIDKIIGLSAGGDDYMTKPFMPGELIARIKAHLRRISALKLQAAEGAFEDSRGSSPMEEDIYEFPGLTVNMTTHEVIADGSPANLTAKEFEMLRLFIKNPKRIYSAQQLFELAWKTNTIDGDSKTVMVYVSTLRKKIEVNPKNPKYILSIRGYGYKFNHKLFEG